MWKIGTKGMGSWNTVYNSNHSKVEFKVRNAFLSPNAVPKKKKKKLLLNGQTNKIKVMSTE